LQVVQSSDGGATFHGQVEHPHVVVDHHDVGDGAPVGVDQVGVSPARQNQSKTLFLVEDGGKA